MTLDEWPGAFAEELAKLPREYLKDALYTDMSCIAIPCLPTCVWPVTGDSGAGNALVIYPDTFTFGWILNEDSNDLTPGFLADCADRICKLLVSDEADRIPQGWIKPRGMPIRYDGIKLPPLAMKPATKRLIVRMDWHVETSHDFHYLVDHIRLRGRFGAVSRDEVEKYTRTEKSPLVVGEC